MWWLWIVGPVLVLVIYLLTARPDKRRLREIELWRASWGPDVNDVEKTARGYRNVVERKKDRHEIGAKRVKALASDLAAAIVEVADGRPLGIFELIPKNAYLGVYEANFFAGSDHQTVVCRLAERGPSFTARPLPIVDGQRVPNHGVQFAKDPEFMQAYVVEGTDQKAIKAWLGPTVREQLLDMPDLWLTVHGAIMTITLFGRADADRIDDLVAAADVIYAEHGADGKSLFGEPTVSKPMATKGDADVKKSKKKKSAKPTLDEMAAIVEKELAEVKAKKA